MFFDAKEIIGTCVLCCLPIRRLNVNFYVSSTQHSYHKNLLRNIVADLFEHLHSCACKLPSPCHLTSVYECLDGLNSDTKF